MIMVDPQGQATHYPHARPLPVRKPRQVAAYVRLCTLIFGVLMVLFYIIGAHAQAQAEQACTPSHTGEMTFNPCAHLDTTQVQDQRVGAPTCVWNKETDQWVSLPCHYTDDTLDVTIQHQP